MTNTQRAVDSINQAMAQGRAAKLGDQNPHPFLSPLWHAWNDGREDQKRAWVISAK